MNNPMKLITRRIFVRGESMLFYLSVGLILIVTIYTVALLIEDSVPTQGVSKKESERDSLILATFITLIAMGILAYSVSNHGEIFFDAFFWKK